MNIVMFILGFIIGVVILLTIYFLKKNESLKIVSSANEIAEKIRKEAITESDTLKKKAIIDGKDEWFKTQKTYQKEIDERKRELRNLEKKSDKRLASLDKRLDNLDRKEDNIEKKEQKISNREGNLQEKEKEINLIVSEQEKKLQEIANLTKDEAIEILRKELIDDAKKMAAKQVHSIEEDTKLRANQKAAGIIATAVQRLAVDHISESTVSVVSLPDDEMKGRIIGREGRNIRAFEKASGADLIVDDTPEAVVISCFDPVRREIARLSLEKLIMDGRIHPGRIESLLKKTAKEMDENLISIGEQACLETNIHNISPNLVKIIGRLQYRTSYGQNVLKHSMESAWVGGMLAAELGLDQDIARRAGFLHDIGKAIDHDTDGSHALIGGNLARKNGESKIIINAIEAHHEEVEATSVYSVLIQTADAISGARPGARREMLESYMKRLEKLEEIASNIDGVNKSYAIQAGRELRIIVDPEDVNDEKSLFIATDIAKEIEKEMQYPGQIKVTVIRETRQSAIAK
ncbi:MAG: ribonuclease Y [Candidatus Cloacimonadota bacterium]|nr:ribonuclease Y [Candidatus Cloacimonadota bacterium]